MIFRLSQKLNAKIKGGPLPTRPLNDNPIADWSAHLFVVERRQLILLSNSKSLYSMLMFGRRPGLLKSSSSRLFKGSPPPV